jgi:hypothetical protein
MFFASHANNVWVSLTLLSTALIRSLKLACFSRPVSLSHGRNALSGLLSATRLPASCPPSASFPAGSGFPRFPFRLLRSPDTGSHFRNAIFPVAHHPTVYLGVSAAQSIAPSFPFPTRFSQPAFRCPPYRRRSW